MSLLLVVCLLLTFVARDEEMRSFLLGASLAIALVKFGEDIYSVKRNPEKAGAAMRVSGR